MQTPQNNRLSPSASAARHETAAQRPDDARWICRVLPASGALRQPWRNGGGITHQIAVWPPAAQGGDLIWRISTADVAQPGSFSNWDGFERQLWVTHGAGMRLTDPASGAVTLLRQGMSLDFPGERRYACDLLEGPVRDLNVMLRRGHGAIRSARLCGAHTVDLGTGHTIIYCVRGSAQVRVADSRSTALAAGDALLVQQATATDRPRQAVIHGQDSTTECIAIALDCGTPLPPDPALPGK
ncbi:HutD family protein [Castellaniella caeni]